MTAVLCGKVPVVPKESEMKTRFAFVALVSMLFLNVAVANTGDPLDVNKDNIIDETDADIVILHINTYGVTDVTDDMVNEFAPWDDSGLEFTVPLLGAEAHVYDITNIGPTVDDIERLNYCLTWERKDVNNSGTITAADALAIINWVNSH
jgi:hypothetical protein